VPERTGLSRRASGTGVRARRAACGVVQRFGYLQLDSVCVTGARTHSIVLMSRLDGASPALGETLLQPGTPVYEYWGHEACWLPLDLYPAMAFRRREFAVHPWWGDVLGDHPEIGDHVMQRLADEGPLRAIEFKAEPRRAGWWNLGAVKKVLSALWSRGDIVVRRRLGFQREFDLAERVIPDEVRTNPLPRDAAIRQLLLRALAGHGWATTGTLAATWRFRNMGPEVREALAALEDAGEIVEAELDLPAGPRRGWIRPADAELAATLRRARPRQDRGVLVSPFDPLIWDRPRTEALFDFRQAIEIYKPKPEREFGYYCLPVLAGDRFIGRIDLKAHRDEGRLQVCSNHWEDPSPEPRHRAAAEGALLRFAEAVELEPDPLR
jgi:uncharacterized protein YcaQ